MHQIGLALCCLLMSVALTARSAPLSVLDAYKRWQEAEAAVLEATEAEIKYRLNRLPAPGADGRTPDWYRGDPSKWNPTKDLELSNRTSLKELEREKALQELQAAKAAAARAEQATLPKKTDIGRIPPAKPPKLQGQLTKGPKTLPDIGDTFPGPIDPHDPWPIPWTKPKC